MIFLVAVPAPELVEGFGFEPAGFDAKGVDLFLDSISNFSSCFHSSSLSFSFFFSLKRKCERFVVTTSKEKGAENFPLLNHNSVLFRTHDKIVPLFQNNTAFPGVNLRISSMSNCNIIRDK